MPASKAFSSGELWWLRSPRRRSGSESAERPPWKVRLVLASEHRAGSLVVVQSVEGALGGVRCGCVRCMACACAPA